MAKEVKKSFLKYWWRKTKPKIIRFFNILLAVAFFAGLMSSAFQMSFIFGCSFIVAFAIAIDRGELKEKPWRPLAVFVGALIIRYGLDQFIKPIFAAQTILDLSIALLVFVAIIFFGWKIKRS